MLFEGFLFSWVLVSLFWPSLIFSSWRLRPALAGSGVPGKNSFLAVRLFSSLPTKEKNAERFRKNAKSYLFGRPRMTRIYRTGCWLASAAADALQLDTGFGAPTDRTPMFCDRCYPC